MPNIICVTNLTKKYKDIIAVNDICFNVRTGDIFAFLGPNGAGKTTTIKMLITLLAPTSGSAELNGLDIARSSAAVRQSIGYVPQMLSVDGALTARENLKLMARLYDIPKPERAGRVDETIKFLNLERQADALVRTFSGGMIRKLEIGQAMMHRPKVLFLDEPTTGLDPLARQSVWRHLLELKNKYGTTIFFSTHYMDEAEDNADQIAIMHGGKIAVIGTSLELKQKTGRADATLDDAFAFFAGTKLQINANFKEIRRNRAVGRRLG